MNREKKQRRNNIRYPHTLAKCGNDSDNRKWSFIFGDLCAAHQALSALLCVLVFFLRDANDSHTNAVCHRLFFSIFLFFIRSLVCLFIRSLLLFVMALNVNCKKKIVTTKAIKPTNSFYTYQKTIREAIQTHAVEISLWCCFRSYARFIDTFSKRKIWNCWWSQMPKHIRWM